MVDQQQKEEEHKPVEEEKKLPDTTTTTGELKSDSKAKQDDDVAHVGDVDEVHVVCSSRGNISVEETSTGFSTATLALTAGAALGIGILLGRSAHNKRS